MRYRKRSGADMQMSTSIKNVLIILGVLAFASSIHAEEDIQQEEANHQIVQNKVLAPRVKYKLLDLGETDVDPSKLSRKAPGASLAPSINNLGQVSANRKEGGFIWDRTFGEYAPYVHDVTISFHGLNNSGDILVSFNRKFDSLEWGIWPTTQGVNGKRVTIPTRGFKGDNLCLCAINNNRTVIGYFKNKEGKTQPVYWTVENGLRYLHNLDGKEITGDISSLNNQGTIAGFFERWDTFPPAVWHSQKGVEFLNNYRQKVVPDGTVELGDLLLTEDDIVYGTYKIKYASQDNSPEHNDLYYAYAWSPSTGGFKLLDLDGMRINAINSSHVLVGSINGKPVVCEPGKKPVEFMTLLKPEEAKSWEQIELTGINDTGQIVGYGKSQGVMRVFLAERLW